MDSISALQITVFQEFINDSFLLTFESKEYNFKLLEATALQKFENQNHQPFSLIFELTHVGPEYFEQGLFDLTHKTLGTIQLFLVPIGPNQDSGKMRYEAIFN